MIIENSRNIENRQALPGLPGVSQTLTVARDLHQRGWALLAARVSDRVPDHPWRETQLAAEDLPKWFSGAAHLVGIITGKRSRVFVVDCDEKKGGNGIEQFANLGEIPATFTVRSPTGGLHYYFRHPGADHKVKTSAKEIAADVDIRGDGGFIFAPGNPGYEIVNSAAIAKAPQWLLDLVVEKERSATTAPVNDNRDAEKAIETIARIVSEWDIETLSYGAWYQTLMAFHYESHGDPRALELFNKWCASDTRPGQYPGRREIDRRWSRCEVNPARPLTFGTVFHHIEQTDANAYAALKPAMTIEAMFAEMPVASTLPGMTIEATPLEGEIVPHGVDIGNATHADIAEIAVEKLGHRLRYVPELGRWLRFDGSVWRTDHTVKHDVSKICAHVAGAALQISESAKRALCSHSTIQGVTKLAESDPAIISMVNQFDANPWLLNTPGGVVDLKTGELRPAHATDLFRWQTAVTPADGEDCPTWLKFLDTATGGDAELINYLKRLAGYSLAGVNTEHDVFVLHGHGGNGKGVFMNTLGAILGDYQRTGASEAFSNTKNNQHLTFIASLVGRRFVRIPEMPDGVTWNLKRIKEISAGDEVTANFMRGDPFDFQPVCKLVFAVNEPPSLTSAGNDVRRRFKFIPFGVTIPEHEQDKKLGEKLQAEGEAILRWAINGCLEWQADGLNAPKAVTDATREYIDSEDPIGQWLADCSTVDASGKATNLEIETSWKIWAAQNGIEPMSMVRLSKQLRKYGLMQYRASDSRGWKGRKFRSELPPGDTGRSYHHAA